MIPYWIMLLLPAAFLLLYRHGGKAPLFPLYVYGVLLTLFIGLRTAVGCDWYNYEVILYRVVDAGLLEGMGLIDPAYAVLNLVGYELGMDIYLANFVCAAVFVYGFVRFARRQPLPYLFVVAAFPMLIVTVSMGYTRQGTAIGLLMLALNAFSDRKLISYLLLVGCAALFHSTALMFAPAALFLNRRKMAIPLVIGLFVVGTVLSAVLDSRLRSFIELYITSNTFEGTTSAAIYRVSLNAVATVLFLLVFRRWRRTSDDFFLYMLFLGVSTLSFFAMTVSAIAADRIALYFLPLQAGVFARIPILAGGREGSWVVALAVVIATCAIMAVWFAYATHSACWLPYRNLMLPNIF